MSQESEDSNAEIWQQQQLQHSHQQTSGVDVLLVTVTEVEARAVFKQFPNPRTYYRGDQTYYDLGIIAGTKIAMVQSEMGAGGQGGAILTIQEAIAELHPSAVIMVGIAFGVDDKKQSIGDILVSRQILDYELQRVGTGSNNELVIIDRGDRPSASPKMLSRFRDAANFWQEAPKVRIGLILSGAKLVDNQDFRGQLLSFGPEAVGGEMEGAGLYAAAQRKKVDWILVKGICDWADGKKDAIDKGQNRSQRQEAAATNAVSFTLYVISRGGFSNPNATASPHQQPQDTPSSQSNNSSSKDIDISTQNTKSIKIFTIYADEDKKYMKRLETQLAPYTWDEKITLWDKDRLNAAPEFLQQMIDSHIDSSRIILLLVSPNFPASKQCRTDMGRAMQRRISHKTIVIPIYIRPTNWSDAPFAGLLSLPRNGKPVNAWSSDDEAWYNVAMDIHKAYEGLPKP